MSSLFKFKQFDIAQDRCAQKVGTDGVLLGAWTTIDEKANKVLDIGTGTGLISLMLAQRTPHGDIDAIELDTDAFEQCTQNFENSVWADRLYCYHASFQEFYEEVEDRYDLIVSNPPFFESTAVESREMTAREHARFEESLPFEELIYGVYKLLSLDGSFSCIIPADREERFTEIAHHFQLATTRKTYVKGTAASAVKRILLELRFRESVIQKGNKTSLAVEQLIIEKARHHYTDEYIALTKDFYLKM